MAEITETFVEILYPGSLFPEEETVKVAKREPEVIAEKYPRSFCFQFYDLTSTKVTVDGKTRTVCGDRKNLSKKYFPGGDIFSAKQLREMPGMNILIFNMEGNGWKRVVRTRRGNFQPFEKDCVLL